jgi:hypothetical protein
VHTISVFEKAARHSLVDLLCEISVTGQTERQTKEETKGSAMI